MELVKAFEKSINAALTILGYDTKLLGQGMGRVPDGLALDHDNSYAILWDAKIRESGYSMGTDDRAIREYVMNQSREIKKRRSLRNIYYVVVSSAFKDDFDDLIRSLKMETDTNEVCLLEVGALVAMVDSKLRNPSGVSLGPDGLQRLFSMQRDRNGRPCSETSGLNLTVALISLFTKHLALLGADAEPGHEPRQVRVRDERCRQFSEVVRIGCTSLATT